MWSESRLGALAGATGGLAMVLASLALQPLAGLPTLPALLQDRLVKLTPGPLFGLLIDRLQYAGRPLLFSGLLLAELVALTIVGALAATLDRRFSRAKSPHRGHSAWRIAVLAIVLWLTIGLLVLPLAGLGPFALASRFASSVLLWGFALEALLYSTAMWLIFDALTEPAGWSTQAPAAGDPLRRGVTASVALVALATLGTTALLRYRGERVSSTTASLLPAGVTAPDTSTAVATAPTAGETTTAGAAATVTPSSRQTAAVTSARTVRQESAVAKAGAATTNIPATPLLTPTGAFYVVSKNLEDPQVKAASWHLTVKGLVSNPLTLSYQALTALPSIEQYRTLACISNDVGGSLMSNALWRGVPLTQLLDQAGADPSAAFILFTSVDGYTESLPMAAARQPSTLVAYQMNGVPLPPEHGFPARIILAGRYGMKNPKWLNAVTASKVDRPGFWEQQGWDEQAVVRTTSRIDGPKDGATLSGSSIAISGVAYAGDRGIRSVEVQVIPGTPWTAAILQPVDAVSTWAAWRYTWAAPKPGSYHISVRAADGTGTLQEAKAQNSFPLGATGLHTITVQVR